MCQVALCTPLCDCCEIPVRQKEPTLRRTALEAEWRLLTTAGRRSGLWPGICWQRHRLPCTSGNGRRDIRCPRAVPRRESDADEGGRGYEERQSFGSCPSIPGRTWRLMAVSMIRKPALLARPMPGETPCAWPLEATGNPWLPSASIPVYSQALCSPVKNSPSQGYPDSSGSRSDGFAWGGYSGVICM
jgi:hypothetical protein